jgi:pimeloyl-ACP methyl ester carboxylesterase
VVTDPQDLFVEIDELELCYRDQGDSSHELVLMIMGLTSQLIHWPQGLVDKLVAESYRVIRFDNRDSGRTRWLGQTPGSYRLRDMADDAVQLLDHLEIDKAHVVGASMGGMIAQRLAIDTPQRVQSLCSIMSTTGRLSVGGAEPGVIEQLIKPPPDPPDRDETIAQIFAIYERIGSKKYAAEERQNRQSLAEAAYDRGTDEQGNPRHKGAGARQVAAIIAGGDRTEVLKDLKDVPTLVIHGNEDSLINISGGRATRDAIPDAQWLAHPDDNGDNGVDGMGHDLPTPLHDPIVNAIVANTVREPAVA